MDKFLEFLNSFDIHTILPFYVMLWYISHRIESKLDKYTEKNDQNIAQIDQKITQHDSRTDKLYETFMDLIKESKNK